MRFLWLKLLFVGLFKTSRIFCRFHKNHLAGNLFNSEYDFYSYLTITTHLNIFHPLNIFYNCTHLPEFGCIRRKNVENGAWDKNFPAELNQMTDKIALAQCQPSVIWHFRDLKSDYVIVMWFMRPSMSHVTFWYVCADST